MVAWIFPHCHLFPDHIFPNNHYSKQRIQRIPTPSNHASTQTSPFISRATSDSNVSTPIRTKIYSIPMADLLDRLSSSGRRSSYCAAWISEARIFGVRRTVSRSNVGTSVGRYCTWNSAVDATVSSWLDAMQPALKCKDSNRKGVTQEVFWFREFSKIH